ncbi:MAG: S-adenosylmethionine:tRNA ribosyltransferase-isomerase, partial [Acidimicrobiia bacterium]|nr:S-adenosylmethionine:tRNA ribosyltransferase-isomerase [Acidimicrobiia bacterium]
GSAAAPTAGLHFTPDLLSRLALRGVGLGQVDLEVGLDTFRPITAELITDHRIHTERCSLDEHTAQLINDRRARGGQVVAVGTTVARTLETFALPDGTVEPGARTTELYITPGYRFRTVDILMTNFHVPRSSLLVMVAAFAGDVWRAAYAVALERSYRFLSFGDAMLLERTE